MPLDTALMTYCNQSLVVTYPYRMPFDEDLMDLVGPNLNLKIQTVRKILKKNLVRFTCLTMYSVKFMLHLDERNYD
jgi:hypothetical protein